MNNPRPTSQKFGQAALASVPPFMDLPTDEPAVLTGHPAWELKTTAEQYKLLHKKISRKFELWEQARAQNPNPTDTEEADTLTRIQAQLASEFPTP